MPVRRLLLAAILCGWVSNAAADPPHVAVEIDGNGGIVVPAMVNGSGPYRFLLDTGASHSVVSRTLADRLQLPVVARTTVITSTGTDLRPVVRLDLTAIGPSRSEGLLASIVPTTQLAAIADRIEGIIGQDFLFDFNYTLDYRRQRLSWHGSADAPAGAQLPLIARAGRYLVEVPMRNGQPPLLLVPDSGANGFVMFVRGGLTRVPLEAMPQTAAVHSLSGRQDVRMMMMRELCVGSVTLKDQTVAVLARDGHGVDEGDGLLPLHLFASVTFNARGGYVVFRM